MAKRKTKEQRQKEELAALRQRVDDLFTGACGYQWNEDEAEPWPTEFMSFVRPLKLVFCVGETEHDEGNEWMWGLWNLDKFRNPETATEFLYENGVRA